eukprot:6471359-Amphidinium_carterae.3
MESQQAGLLRDQFHVLLQGSSHRRSLTDTSEVIIGHRGTRKRGLTAFTLSHEPAVRLLVGTINKLFQDVSYNAIALVNHRSTPVHKDGANHAEHDMVIFPQQQLDGAWFWAESVTGCSPLSLGGTSLLGSWVPFNRVICLCAAKAHMIQTDSSCSSLVLYRTQRMPKTRHLAKLVHLDFPLCVDELAKLAAGDSESDSADNEHGGEAEVSEEEPPNRQTEVLTMMKTQRDENLRNVPVHLCHGSTVCDARDVLRRMLKLHPARIQHSVWSDEAANTDPLPDCHVLSLEEAPYFIYIIPHAEVASSVRSLEPSAKQTVIGAPRGAQAARQSSASMAKQAGQVEKETQGARRGSFKHDRVPLLHPRAGSATAVGGASSSSDPQGESVQQLCNRGVLSTPFEQWVAARILKIESDVRTLATGLRQLVASGSEPSSSVAPAPPRAIGSRSNVRTKIARSGAPVAGGGNKRQRVCQHSLEQVVVTALGGDISDIPDSIGVSAKLVEHIARYDSKFVRSAFQACDKSQRLSAFAAALCRAGLDAMGAAVYAASSLARKGMHDAVPVAVKSPDSQSSFPKLPAKKIPPRPTGGNSEDQPVQQRTSDVESKLDLQKRVRALEIWAHTLDVAERGRPVISSDAVLALTSRLGTRLEQMVADKLVTPPTSLPSNPGIVIEADVVKQPQDGDCLYHALSFALNDGTTSTTLKQEVRDFVQANPDFLVADTPLREWSAWEREDIASSVHADSRIGWGGAVELAVLPELRKVNIAVFTQRSASNEFLRTALFAHPSASRCVNLLFSHGNHYDVLCQHACGSGVGMKPGSQLPESIRLAQLEKQVELCLRLCGNVSSDHAGDSKLQQMQSQVHALGAHVKQIAELVRMHTIAIVRNWHWASSSYQATVLSSRKSAQRGARPIVASRHSAPVKTSVAGKVQTSPAQQVMPPGAPLPDSGVPQGVVMLPATTTTNESGAEPQARAEDAVVEEDKVPGLARTVRCADASAAELEKTVLAGLGASRLGQEICPTSVVLEQQSEVANALESEPVVELSSSDEES